MGLVSETVWITLGCNCKYYEEKGYEIPKHIDKYGNLKYSIGERIEVKVDDLPLSSRVKVLTKCDNCGKERLQTYDKYKKYVKEDGKIYCNKCATKLFSGDSISKTKLKKSKSFYDWCVENDSIDVILRWDYELNDKTPKEVCYSTHKKYWFKCDKHSEHASELKSLNRFVKGQEGSIACNQCKSIAQYILDNFPNKKLYEVWDKDKNKDDSPWEIAKGNHSKKYWFICQEKDYHGSYEMSCNDFTNSHRCPYCNSNSGKVHPNDSIGQYIIDNYGEDFLYRVWSSKNDKNPFELSIGSNKKVWWKCQNNEHKDFFRNCYNSIKFEFRCPNCSKESDVSIIETKTKTYLQDLNYEVLSEHNCTIRPINPKTKMPMPYDNEVVLINGKHLIIEVHGKQHYRSDFYKTINKCSYEEAEKILKQRKLYDRYKKAYAEHFDYEYLEIPYWAFEGKNKYLYKQMIDNKIKEILRKVG